MTGDVDVSRAYYHCRACQTGTCPADATLGLQADALSPGFRPLVTLAGVLASFADGADDLLRRFAGRRVSAGTVWRATERAGQEWIARTRAGSVVVPSPPQPAWDFTAPDQTTTIGYLGLDAFRVPIQHPDGTQADSRMLYIGLVYTPDKTGTEYVTDWNLDQVCAGLRQRAIARGFGRVDRVIAVSDAGNGLEAGLRRHFDDGLLCILDWYHAVEHLHTYARAVWADEATRESWVDRAKGTLYDRGGAGFVAWIRDQPLPSGDAADEARRLLLGYFDGTLHRTDYPAYRAAGYDLGSGPTEAGCKVVGARLKGAGMRWTVNGAAAVAALRAIYQSGPAFWTGSGPPTRGHDRRQPPKRWPRKNLPTNFEHTPRQVSPSWNKVSGTRLKNWQT
ncbi:hypothetical protein FRUB_10627 [Fimbriiglobus ruber]|uniref:ISKra4 family transposase n=1 Tax=Fimbriiglobus ruber TaxID=1908690 RepID=A0A225DBI4_9BACT|nr:hypothetical protein FRUB_10627 [Fimbriiglobus ruber]